MPYHSEIRLLPYSSRQMFDLVAAIEQYPDFLPWCLSAHIRSRHATMVIADLVIGYKMFRETFTSEVAFDRPQAIIVHYRSGPLSRLSNSWHFTAKGKNQCEIKFEVDFDFQSPFLRAAINLFFDKALRKMVGAFETRAALLYGPKSLKR